MNDESLRAEILVMIKALENKYGHEKTQMWLQHYLLFCHIVRSEKK
jgi:hypothetical protein